MAEKSPKKRFCHRSWQRFNLLSLRWATVGSAADGGLGGLGGFRRSWRLDRPGWRRGRRRLVSEGFRSGLARRTNSTPIESPAAVRRRARRAHCLHPPAPLRRARPSGSLLLLGFIAVPGGGRG